MIVEQVYDQVYQPDLQFSSLDPITYTPASTLQSQENQANYASLFNAFSILLSLASAEAISECKEDVERIILTLGCVIASQGTNMVSEAFFPFFTDCIQSNIAKGVTAPFLLLYSAACQEEFNHWQMFLRCKHYYSLQCTYSSIRSSANHSLSIP